MVLTRGRKREKEKKHDFWLHYITQKYINIVSKIIKKISLDSFGEIKISHDIFQTINCFQYNHKTFVLLLES